MDTPDSAAPVADGNKTYNIGQINNATFVQETVQDPPFNEILLDKLINAIIPYNPKAEQLLSWAAGQDPKPDISNYSISILTYSFVGIIGMQLTKLFAIGADSKSNSRRHDYVDMCVVTAKRVLQIICFAIISDLWNKEKGHRYALTDEQTKKINNFFVTPNELPLRDYLILLSNLCGVYAGNSLPLPISELSAIESQLTEGAFFDACCKLQDINAIKNTDEKYAPKNCIEAETQLSVILTAASFLAAYKVVSIKNIGYEGLRNTEGRYLHKYVTLGQDSDQNINSEKMNYANNPINTDSVLLYRVSNLDDTNLFPGVKETDIINMFPFIIDYNALTEETEGVKICFYSCVDLLNNKVMTYSFLDDNSPQKITFTDTQENDPLINDIIKGKGKRTDLKLDTVWRQVKEAKVAIIGS